MFEGNFPGRVKVATAGSILVMFAVSIGILIPRRRPVHWAHGTQWWIRYGDRTLHSLHETHPNTR